MALNKKEIPLDGSYVKEFKYLRRNFRIGLVADIMLVLVLLIVLTIFIVDVTVYEQVPYLTWFDIGRYIGFALATVFLAVSAILKNINWQRIHKFHDDAKDVIYGKDIREKMNLDKNQSIGRLNLKVSRIVKKNIRISLLDETVLEGLGRDHIISKEQVGVNDNYGVGGASTKDSIYASNEDDDIDDVF